MLKKFGVVTALAGTVLFGAAFQNPAHAQSNNGQTDDHSYKVYYSVNTDCSHLSQKELKNILNRYDDDDSVFGSYHTHGYEPKTNQNSESTNHSSENPVPADQGQTNPGQTQDHTQSQDQGQYQPGQSQTQQQPQTQTDQQQPSQTQTQSDQQQGSQLSQFEKEVVKLTNQERTQRGLQPLKINTTLSKMARDKSQDMANNNYFSHQSPTYGSPFDMMKQYGISYSTAGENIAEGQQTPQEVVNAWMNSPGHRANILNPDFTEIGVGYVAQGNIWTQDFIGN